MLRTGSAMQSLLWVCGRSVKSDSVTPWTVAHQAPLFMGFPRQEYQSGLPFPPPGDLPNPGIEPVSLVSPAFAGGFFTSVLPGKLPSRDTKYSLLAIQNMCAKFASHHIQKIEALG